MSGTSRANKKYSNRRQDISSMSDSAQMMQTFSIHSNQRIKTTRFGSANATLLPSPATESMKQWRIRQGDSTAPSLKTITRKGTIGVTYDPLHPRLQADLLPRRQTCYGKSNVMREEGFVDITARDGKRCILIEIKTHPNPRAAIREALGQILEYAYYGPQARSGSIELVIIAPGKLKAAEKKYIRLLQTRFKLPIWYCSHSEGDPLPGLFRKGASLKQ
jgi:hypothetical protein